MKFNHTPVNLLPELTSSMKRGKRWYTTPEGNKYPSVTTILGHETKDGLEQWKQALGKSKASKETKRCSDRGTAVHAAVEDFLKNDESYKDHVTDPDHERVFNNMRLRLKKIDNIQAQEMQLYSDRFGIAGCVDCIADYKGIPTIIDFKTSTHSKSEQLIEDYFLQCTAYALMFEEHFQQGISQIAVIIGCEKGLAKVYVREINNYIAPLLRRIARFKEDNGI